MLNQIHIIHNLPPSSPNRDRTGAPKDAFFGGHRRARISSQALKYALRHSDIFRKELSDALLSVRTRHVSELIREELKELKVDRETIEQILAIVPSIGTKEETKEKKDDVEGGDEKAKKKTSNPYQTNQLMVFAHNEVKELSKTLLELYQKLGEKDFKKEGIRKLGELSLTETPKAVDIAMFGRMSTSSVLTSVDAAVQVSHAISANAVMPEFDYYIGSDDLSDSGAGIIGDSGFNSSVYYSYYSVHWDKLVENLDGDADLAKKAVVAMTKALMNTHVSGKSNSFAPFTERTFVMVEVSENNIPLNYANAFVKPIRPTKDLSLTDAAVDSFINHINKVTKTYNLTSDRVYINMADCGKLESGSQVEDVNSLVKWVGDKLPA